MAMANPSQSAIIWPPEYLPGTTDNFVSNEVIARGITAAQVWALLSDMSKWETYYKNCSQITPPPSSPHLEEGDAFKFSTFGFPPLACTVRESVPPSPSIEGSKRRPGRIAWCADEEDDVKVYHAWLVEDLEGGRVRILTQESQAGSAFVGMREKRPNVMLLGHQDWLDGLVRAARGEEGIGETNLGSVGAWERK